MINHLEHEAWTRRAEVAHVTRRGKRWYDKAFDIKSDERILDLGPGRSRFLAPNLVRLDYTFKEDTPKRGINVAGLFQQLPFADESFDRVVASWSFYWVGGSIARAMSEALRVTKPGGQVQINPVRHVNHEVSAHLEETGSVKLKEATQYWPPKHLVAAFLGAGVTLGAGVVEAVIDPGIAGPPLQTAAINLVVGGLVAGAYVVATRGEGIDYTLTVNRQNYESEADRLTFAEQLVQTYQMNH